MSRCLSELALDRLALGEPAEGAREHLAGCERCAGRFAAIEADRRAFRAAPPPLRRRRAAIPWVAVGMLAAAAVLLVVLPRPPGDTRLKGGARLGFYVRHGEEVRLGGPGALLAPGDAVSFYAVLAEPRWVAVISVDGAGRRTVYVPPQRLEAGPEQRIAASTILDGVLGAETLTAYFCPAPFDALAAPDGCEQDVLRVEKRP